MGQENEIIIGGIGNWDGEESGWDLPCNKIMQCLNDFILQ